MATTTKRGFLQGIIGKGTTKLKAATTTDNVLPVRKTRSKAAKERAVLGENKTVNLPDPTLVRGKRRSLTKIATEQPKKRQRHYGTVKKTIEKKVEKTTKLGLSQETQSQPVISESNLDLLTCSSQPLVDLSMSPTKLARFEELSKQDSVLAYIRDHPSEAPHEHYPYVMQSFFLEIERENWYKTHIGLKDFLAGDNPMQPNIKPQMLTMLFDWLVEVQENFEMNLETLYMAVKLTYIFLSNSRVLERNNLQLLASTAMWLSSKYEERNPPVLHDFIYICDDAYTYQDFVRMEQRLLKTIDFSMNWPLSYTYLRRYIRMIGHNETLMSYLARFLLEMTLISHPLNLEPEYVKAAASLWLARAMLKMEPRWPEHASLFTACTERELLPMARSMHELASKAPIMKNKTIYQKYCNIAFRKVAETPVLPDSFFDEVEQTI